MLLFHVKQKKIKALLQRLIDLKQHNKNLKVIVSVGGWKTGSLIFSIIANNVASRAQFTQSVVEFLQQYECDGVNIAWMHPSQRG
jgi:chitinase